MVDGSPIVYLEDVEVPSKNTPSTSVAATATGASNRTFFTNVQPGKRQRTLADMFSGSQEKEDGESEPSAKKPKLTAQGTASLTKLNAIPFSLSAYQESLSEEEKRLLALECDTMGKSWYESRKF
jgi:uracil-DNA glycosylase